jgi:hypothetical protein
MERRLILPTAEVAMIKIYGLDPHNRCDKCEARHLALVAWMRRHVLFAAVAVALYVIWAASHLPSDIHTGIKLLDLILIWLSLGILGALGAGFGAGAMITILSGIPGMYPTQVYGRNYCADCGAPNVRT